MEHQLSAPITIFEGVDGGGKTTAARLYAAATGARYVHCPSFAAMYSGLARLYFEMCLPALLGFQPVVLDRAWLSEPIYGTVMRQGRIRITPIFQRMLERVVLRAGAVVVHCHPSWEHIQQNYRQRIRTEYVSSEAGLRRVYDMYTDMRTALPVVSYNFEDYMTDTLRVSALQQMICGAALDQKCHPLQFESAGRWTAPVVFVGERFAEHKDKDSWYQYPFVSWTKEGCSQWFTTQLLELNISERDVLWVNIRSDYGEADLRTLLALMSPLRPTLIALGSTAGEVAARQGVRALHIPHPQYWKRFHVRDEYSALHDALRIALTQPPTLREVYAPPVG